MSIPEEKQHFVGDGTTWPTRTATFLAQEGGDGFMGARNMTVGRYEEIRRRLGEGRRVREIARALGRSRRTVREVRDGLRGSPAAPKGPADPRGRRPHAWLACILPALPTSGTAGFR